MNLIHSLDKGRSDDGVVARSSLPADSGQRGTVAVAGRRRRREHQWPPARLSLALQGGGSFGAFTWGVLDRLLDEERIALDAVSGSSAGALNAVLLASGLAEGGSEIARRGAAKRKLARFWKRLSEAGPLSWIAAATAAGLPGFVISPYHLNPFGLNPLRDLLREEVDFARLRSQPPPLRLLIAATRVSDGQLRLFRESEITLEAVLASCCLPQLHHAVEIEGEAYWDGGFSANPPLRQLAIDSEASDILLVQLLPTHEDGTPRNSTEIARRLSGIAFNEPLLKELEALEDLRALCRAQKVLPSKLCRKINRLELHRIAAAEAVPDLNRENPIHVDWPLLSRLHEAGVAAADGWLSR
jgi:NTE family protein